MNKEIIIKSIYDSIDRGRKGENTGLYMGFNRLSKHICNIQKRTYYLIGGSTGSGKTAFLNSVFLLNPYEHIKSTGSPTKLEVIYYSLEMPPEDMIVKMLAKKMWEEYGILSFTNEIFSRGDYRIKDNISDILESYKGYTEELLSDTLFLRDSLTPDYLYKDVMGYYESRGKIIRGEGNMVLEYKPNNPNVVTIIIVDHIGLIEKNKSDKSKKDAIDRLSRLLVWFRNKFDATVVVTSQFNRSLEGMDRRAQDYVEPQLADFKETGSTQEDANVVMALFYPFRFGVENFKGYDITKLRKRFRSLHLLKNRDGEDGITMGMHFIGEVGKFREMPLPKELEENPSLYTKILNYGNPNKS